MDSIISIWLEMGRVWCQAISSPLFIVLYAVIFFMITWSYGRRSPLTDKSELVKTSLWSVLIGLGAGLLGSALLVAVGVDVLNISILAMWLIALVLALIHPRLICFSYAGGLLSLFYLFSAQSEGCVPQIIGLIAILHLIESGLILLDGSTQPGRAHSNSPGQSVQGFQLQRFWPLLLVMVCTSDNGLGSTMPAWWPLLKCDPADGGGSVYVMLPVLAILGYGETATRTTARRTVTRSACHLGAYSLILLALALLAASFPIVSWLAALFAPLGHEMVIWLGQRSPHPR